MICAGLLRQWAKPPVNAADSFSIVVEAAVPLSTVKANPLPPSGSGAVILALITASPSAGAAAVSQRVKPLAGRKRSASRAKPVSLGASNITSRWPCGSPDKLPIWP